MIRLFFISYLVKYIGLIQFNKIAFKHTNVWNVGTVINLSLLLLGLPHIYLRCTTVEVRESIQSKIYIGG